MIVNDHYTRQQTIAATGLSSGQLSRLDASGLIVPTKIGNPAHPVVLYSAEQLRELAIVAAYSEHLTAKQIHRVIRCIRRGKISGDQIQGRYLILGNQVCFVDRNELGDCIDSMTRKDGVVSMAIVPPVEIKLKVKELER